MSDHWSQGYVTDIDYTHGYYLELNPARVAWAFANKGLASPKIETACELGFGQGLSTVFHGAGSDTNWWATDFNPAQAANAKALVAESGADTRLFDQSFAEFCSRSDLPEFDYIGLHGIWTWISNENRDIVVDFLRRKLKTGGVLYISYNTLPGWSGPGPMRSLIARHGLTMGAPGEPMPERLDKAIEFTEKLFDLNPAYIRMNAYVKTRLDNLKGLSRNYLAHEYFTKDWLPMYVGDMADWLEGAKLSYACSATYLDHVDALNLSADQQTFLNEIPDQILKETVRDYMVNQQFRKDYWVKGGQKISPIDQASVLRDQRFILTRKRDDVELKVTGALGDATMSSEIYDPVLDSFADLKPKTLGEIESQLKGKPINLGQIIQALTVLTGSGVLSHAHDDKTIGVATKHCGKLNSHLLDKSRGSADVVYLVSPVTGGGVSVPRFGQLFLRARNEGHKTPQAWAEATWQFLAAQGQSIMKDGKALPTPEENIAELQSLAVDFERDQLPILEALKIAKRRN